MRLFKTVAVMAVCGSGVLWAQAQMPLGDVVKQKAAKKAVRVITDDDMPQHPARPAAPVPTGSADAAAKTGTADDKEAPISPAVLQQQLKEVNDAITAKKRVIERFQKALEESDPRDLRKEMYETSLQRANWQLETLEAERTTLEQMATQSAAKSAQKSEEKSQADEKPAKDDEKSKKEGKSE